MLSSYYRGLRVLGVLLPALILSQIVFVIFTLPLWPIQWLVKNILGENHGLFLMVFSLLVLLYMPILAYLIGLTLYRLKLGEKLEKEYNTNHL